MMRSTRRSDGLFSLVLLGVLLSMACLAGCASHREAGSVGVLLSSKKYQDAGEIYVSRWLYWDGHRQDQETISGWVLLNREGRYAAMIPLSDEGGLCRRQWLWVTRSRGNESSPSMPPCLDENCNINQENDVRYVHDPFVNLYRIDVESCPGSGSKGHIGSCFTVIPSDGLITADWACMSLEEVLSPQENQLVVDQVIAQGADREWGENPYRSYRVEVRREPGRWVLELQPVGHDSIAEGPSYPITLPRPIPWFDEDAPCIPMETLRGRFPDLKDAATSKDCQWLAVRRTSAVELYAIGRKGRLVILSRMHPMDDLEEVTQWDISTGPIADAFERELRERVKKGK